jgi:Holliday junction resolvase-like predicted endonuclease
VKAMGTPGLAEVIINALMSIWWVIPLAFVILFLKAKINKWEREKKQENRINKRKETKQKEKNEVTDNEYLENIKKRDLEIKKRMHEKFPDMKYVEKLEVEIVEELKEEKKDDQVFAHDLGIKKQKNEFREFTADEKKDYAAKQKEKKEKGALYEAFVAEHYRSLGYEVIEHGKIHGKKDGGIDLIAKNVEEVIMIQCKNWKQGTKYTINHAMISAFVGNVAMFIAKNTEYEKYIIKRVYAISEEILDKSALARIRVF